MTDPVGAMERAITAAYNAAYPRLGGTDVSRAEAAAIARAAILAFLDGSAEDAVYDAIFDHEGSCSLQARAAIRALRALAQKQNDA